MSCARGCCATPAEHYRSLLVASPDRAAMTKTTTHRDSTVEVDVTEHWHDRQDLLVKPQTIRVTREELSNGTT
jgi:hypothetical protein